MLAWFFGKRGASTPSVEQQFALQVGESLAYIVGSVHGYEYWYALKNPQRGATELLVKGPGDWNAPHKSRLTERLPIEAVLASARRVPYDMATRADYARVAGMVLTDNVDGIGRVELQFYRATTVLAVNPVNALIDEIDRAAHHMLLMKPTGP